MGKITDRQNEEKFKLPSMQDAATLGGGIPGGAAVELERGK